MNSLLATSSDSPSASPSTEPSKADNLRKNMMWSALGVSVFGATNWAMNVVLAKLGSPTVVGQYAFAAALSSPIVAFFQLNMRNVMVTDVHNRYRFADYFSVRLICCLLALLVICSFCATGHFGKYKVIVVVMFALGMLIDTISDVIYGRFQKHNRMRSVGISMTVKGFLSLTLLGVVFYLTHSILWAVIASGIASLIIVCFYDMPQSLWLGKRERDEPSRLLDSEGKEIELRKWGRLIWLSLPLGFVILINMLNMNVSRYFIEKYLGDAQLGIFTASLLFISIAEKLSTSMGMAIVPTLSKLYTANDTKQFVRLLSKLAMITVCIGLVTMTLFFFKGRAIVTTLFTSEYAQRMDVVLWLMAAGAVFCGTFSFGYALTSARQFNIQVVWASTVVVATVVSAMYLIPRFGLLGAAISVFITMTTRFLIGSLLVFRLLTAMKRKSDLTGAAE